MHAAPVLRGGRLVRAIWLVSGLFLCACGVLAFLEARLGLGPWDVLHQGIAEHTPLSFGLANEAVAIVVLFLAWLLGSDYLDGLELFREGRRIAVLRTFSKIYGLAGLRVGWAVAPADVALATTKVRRAFDVAATAQAAALASLDEPQEIARRRELNATGRAQLSEILRGHGLEPAGPSRGNFLFADVGGGRELFERLQREGVIVRPLDGFGAPEAIRVTVGTPEENEAFGVALGHVLSGVS